MEALTTELRTLLGVITAAIGLLFLYAGAAKLASLSEFRRSLLLVPHLPHQFAAPVAAAIPTIEIPLGLALLCDYFPAKLLAVVLLCGFSAVAISAARNNQRVPCNCFGAGESSDLSWGTALRNGVFALALLGGSLWPQQSWSMLSALSSLGLCAVYLAAVKSLQNEREYRYATAELIS
jgi:hypothetical protein